MTKFDFDTRLKVPETHVTYKICMDLYEEKKLELL